MIVLGISRLLIHPSIFPSIIIISFVEKNQCSWNNISVQQQSRAEHHIISGILLSTSRGENNRKHRHPRHPCYIHNRLLLHYYTLLYTTLLPVIVELCLLVTAQKKNQEGSRIQNKCQVSKISTIKYQAGSSSSSSCLRTTTTTITIPIWTCCHPPCEWRRLVVRYGPVVLVVVVVQLLLLQEGLFHRSAFP